MVLASALTSISMISALLSSMPSDYYSKHKYAETNYYSKLLLETQVCRYETSFVKTETKHKYAVRFLLVTNYVLIRYVIYKYVTSNQS